MVTEVGYSKLEFMVAQLLKWCFLPNDFSWNVGNSEGGESERIELWDVFVGVFLSASLKE